ncbi:MAG: hypothetical protein LLG37_00805 [Spirochaetia bacterium]|nr:hypothetical protein [Spirochaetia bacterium]
MRTKGKTILFSFIICLFFIPLYAEQSVEAVIIPQSDPVYEDMYRMAEAGLIKSVKADVFRYSAMTDYEAAGYVVEAAAQYAAAGGNVSGDSNMTATLKKYFEIYRKKAFEMYDKSKEMRAKLQEIEQLLKDPEIKSFDETLDEAKETMFDVETEYGFTTFRGVPPFKVMGMLNARWQDVESFGVSPAHHTSLGGTFMSLWTEGIVSSDVSFKLNLTFERPANEAEKKDVPEYWGTGQRFLDKYTINLNLWGWSILTGFFWEDITPYIAKGILSDRPALFDRDPYVLEETTKGHFENAFLHSFVKRGDIWSKHGFMGAEFMNLKLPFDGRFKIMGGKAEKFDEQYDKLYLYEYAGRYTQPIELPGVLSAEVSGNFFNTSNEKTEIETQAPNSFGPNNPVKPDGYLQSETVAGGDFKLKLFNFVNISSELEFGDHYGYLPKPFDQYTNGYPPKYHQQGNALFVEGLLKDLLPVDLSVKFTRIDPDYVAAASAITDTTARTVNAAGTGVDMTYDAYTGDPTLLYNNTQRLDARASIELPVALGFININYGTAQNITNTSNNVFVDHFLFGNRLTGPMYWHLFFSQYGYPVTDRDLGFMAYNAVDHPAIYGQGKGYRYIFTEKWLTNKEKIISNMAESESSIKNSCNASVEFKLSLHKAFAAMGMPINNLFLDLYGELVTLRTGADLMPTFDPETMFSQNLMSAFLVYNVTRKSNIMFEAAVERWATNYSEVCVDLGANPSNKDDDWIVNLPVDYVDTSFGAGYEVDFAPRTSFAFRIKRFFHTDNAAIGNYTATHRDPDLAGTSTFNIDPSTQNFDGWHILLEIKNFF